MIIVGYQGIGKSTVSQNGNGFIDLESGNFWVNGERADNWYVPYCNIANHLSEQGYYVFTSSHAVVREQLRQSKERKVIVCPSPELKDIWIQRLRERYEQTKTDKDFKALANAEDRYLENINELLSEDDTFGKIIIKSIPYDLAYELEEAINRHELFESVSHKPFDLKAIRQFDKEITRKKETKE